MLLSSNSGIERARYNSSVDFINFLNADILGVVGFLLIAISIAIILISLSSFLESD
jgi:hypothetical protein